MVVTPEIAAVRATRWSDPGLSWGFAPTMGYLHEGHLSLVRQARQENERVAASIYVNPTQFGPAEDLAAYPRDLERDLALLEKEKVDLVFTPDTETMYPPGFQTEIQVKGVSQPLEGTARPGHFTGVATVVAKLFNIVQPTRAYFGQKDAQQATVLRRLVEDLNFPIELIVCPTVREKDGLAMSSRNAYLAPAERAAAPILYKALLAARQAILDGEQDAYRLRQMMRDQIAGEPLARLDYVSVADPDTMIELDGVGQKALLSGALFIGKARLIDNILVR